MEWLTSLGEAALTLLFPPRCEVCGTLQEPVVCARCLQQFAAITEPYCRQCGLPLDPLAKTSGHCAACNDEPPLFDAARSAGLYDGALRRAIHVFKYELVRALATPLAEFLATRVTLPFPVDCLCPVPLHPARERMRGFNQSLLLAEQLGLRWQVPVESQLLTRTLNTLPQMSLPHDQRRLNIRDAFMSAGPVRGRSICLVDDVFTTGSTLRECTRVLRRADAGRILVVTLARATRQFFRNFPLDALLLVRASSGEISQNCRAYARATRRAWRPSARASGGVCPEWG